MHVQNQIDWRGTYQESIQGNLEDLCTCTLAHDDATVDLMPSPLSIHHRLKPGTSSVALETRLWFFVCTKMRKSHGFGAQPIRLWPPGLTHKCTRETQLDSHQLLSSPLSLLTVVEDLLHLRLLLGLFQFLCWC
jgi:hypothetical protein